MSQIDSDAALLTALGFSKSEAADRLGRTRQAIDAGLGGRRKGYFKAHDVAVLLLLARKRGHEIDQTLVRRYLASTLDPHDLEQVDDLLGDTPAALAAGAWSEFWVIIPDYRHLRRDGVRRGRTPYELLVGLPLQFPDARIYYVCASPVETQLLSSDLEAAGGLGEHRVFVMDFVPAAAQMTMIVADPYDNPTVFMPTADSFVQVAYFEGDHLVDNLTQLFPEAFPRRKRAVAAG